jgi:hypothetical protein
MAAILLALLVAAPGCGYSFVGYGKGFDDIRTIAILTPANDSFFPGAEYVVADALRHEFLRRGAVRVVNDPGAADLVLGGSVESVRTSGRSFSSVVFTLEYELIVELDLEAWNRDGSKRPIGPDAMRESEYYLASADVEAMRKNRDEAMRRVATLLAQRVHENLFEAAPR